MRSLIFLLALSTFSIQINAEVYKWVDEKGRTHYSNEKPKDKKAETVKATINSYKSVSYGKYKPGTKNPDNNVIMYATSWCGYCKQARNYFNANGIPYTEYDIEKDVDAKAAYDQLGAKGVPVILVGENRMNGFSEAGFQQMYNPKK